MKFIVRGGAMTWSELREFPPEREYFAVLIGRMMSNRSWDIPAAASSLGVDENALERILDPVDPWDLPSNDLLVRLSGFVRIHRRDLILNKLLIRADMLASRSRVNLDDLSWMPSYEARAMSSKLNAGDYWAAVSILIDAIQSLSGGYVRAEP